MYFTAKWIDGIILTTTNNFETALYAAYLEDSNIFKTDELVLKGQVFSEQFLLDTACK